MTLKKKTYIFILKKAEGENRVVVVEVDTATEENDSLKSNNFILRLEGKQGKAFGKTTTGVHKVSG